MDIADSVSTSPAVTVAHPDRVFPTLSPAQIARVARHGRRHAITPGEVLVEVGQRPVPFFVVLNGEVEVLRTSGGTEALFTTLTGGQFTGEGTMLTGRRGLTRLRAVTSGVVIELAREELIGIIQTDAELSEIFMRAFILRRNELIAGGYGDVILMGSTHCAGTLGIEEFLTRNGHPFHYIDLDRDADAQELLDRFHVTADDVPVVICRGEVVLRNPSIQQIADCLGFNDAIDRTSVRDPGDRGCRPGRTGGRRVRRIGGAGCARPRIESARRPGRLELQNRKLSRLSHRHLRFGPHGTRLRASPEVRRAGDHRKGRREACLCRYSVLRAAGRRRPHQRAVNDHRVWGAIPQARDRKRVAV
jgi:CRP-like cAMP-binding protein